jgi:hypothetical protein
MIGHYLLTLRSEEEGRVLTMAMRPGDYVCDELMNQGPCLVGVANDPATVPAYMHDYTREDFDTRTVLHGETAIEYRFDALCRRFGIERITAAIRNRILTNQARRALRGNPRQHELTGAQNGGATGAPLNPI